MTEDEYISIKNAREALQGAVINYKSETTRLEEELVQARSRIDALEQIISNP